MASDATLARGRCHRAVAAGPLTTQQLAPRVICPQNDYIMDDMMADVIRTAPASGAWCSDRTDIAGKTGTTDEAKDTWFNGFNANS